MSRSSVAIPAARKFRRTAAAPWVAVAAVVLAGCGQKGALVLPAAAPSSVPVSMPEAVRPVEQAAPVPAEPAGAASAPVR